MTIPTGSHRLHCCWAYDGPHSSCHGVTMISPRGYREFIVTCWPAVVQLALNFTTTPITIASNSTPSHNGSSSPGPNFVPQQPKRFIGKHCRQTRSLCRICAFMLPLSDSLICHLASSAGQQGSLLIPSLVFSSWRGGRGGVDCVQLT